MKKILSIILAISLILTLLPSFAYATETETETTTTDPAGTLEYLPGTTLEDNLFVATAFASNNPPNLGISDGALHVSKMRADRITGINYSVSNGYAQYVAVRMTINTPGVYYLSIKEGSVDDTQKKVSTTPGIYFFKAKEDDTVTTWEEKRGVSRATYLGTSAPLAYFNLYTAPNGEYAPVIKDDGKQLVVAVPEAGDYIVGFSALPESWKRSTYVLATSAGTAVERSDTNKTSSYSQQMHIAGIKLTPVSELYFNDSIITSMQKYSESQGKNVAAEPALWTIVPGANWTVDSAISRETNYGSQSAKEDFVVISLARSSTSYEPWSTYTTGNANNNNKSRQSMFTIKAKLPSEEGYYRVKVLGGKYNKGTKAAFYVDNKFAGWYDCYDENATESVVDSEAKTLNTVYLTPDSDGTVSVVITSEGPTFSTGNDITTDDINLSTLVLSKIEFEYLGKEKPLSATPDKIVIEEYPEALEEAGTAPISAYVLMKDGSKLQISGMERAIDHATTPLCPQTDKDNFIKVSASENLSIAADFEGKNVQNGVFTNADGKATGTVTANGNGEATITVNAKVDGVALTPVTATVALPEVEEPGEEITETVTLGVMANYEDAASGITSAYKGTSQVAVGTGITAEAKDIDGYKFAYWKDGSRFLSSDNEITVTVARNTALTAVYDVVSEESTSAKIVEFWNADKTLISKVETEGNTVDLPEDPTMTGYKFIGWYTDEETKFTSETELTEDVTRVVAQYELDDATYTVTVDGAENTGKYDAVVEKTAGENFTYWALNNAIMSFNKELNFLTYGAAEIKSVKDDAAEATPTIVLDKVGSSFFIAYETPAGYERIETGIIFGTSKDIIVNSCYSKASAKNKAAFGQFTAKPMNTETYARGYQIFKKDGKVLVIYTDAIEA